jgi:hypothetical protein
MDLTLVAMSLGAIVVGLGACYQGWRRLEPARHIFRNDPVPIRDLLYREGPVEISGTARVDDDAGTAFAPFSGTDCLAYEFEAQEYRGGGQHAHWETVDEGLRAVPFLVEDETAAVSVDPRGADLHLDKEEMTIDPGERPPEQIERYIGHTEDLDLQNDTIDLLVTELNTGNKQRFIERRLDVDESVHVYGDVGRAEAGEWGSRTIDAVLQRSAGVPLVVSDAPERDTAWRIVRDRLLWPAAGAVIVVCGLVGLVYGLGI